MNSPSSGTSSLPEAWQVQLPVFEGPLDLLLHLVKINEVEITDIPVAMICGQFDEYLHLMDVFDLDVAAEFVYEAAVLIHLKSRMLLPRQTAEDGTLEDDPRQFKRLLGLLDPDRPFDLLLDLRQRTCRAEAVAAFLAILELARLDLVRLHRTRSGEILLYGTSKELQAHELEAIQG